MTHLLIVDDDAMVREELGELLRDEGHTVVAVPGGAEALQALSRETFEVMFTDLRMPRMSGIELLREVHQRYPQLYPVMVTGFATAETAVQALQAGAFDYVPKPFRLEQISSVLQHLEQERTFRRQWQELGARPKELVERLARSGKELVVFVWGKDSYVGASVVSLGERGDAPFAGEASALARVEELVRSHVARAASPFVLLERVDRLITDLESERALFAFLEEVSATCRARGGRLLVTVRPQTLNEGQLERLRRALRECFSLEMTNSLASPVRRSLVVRLAAGAANLDELVRTAGIEDEPKAFFHLHKLMEGGIVQQSSDRFVLTEMGKRAAGFIESYLSGPLSLPPAPGLLTEAR